MLSSLELADRGRHNAALIFWRLPSHPSKPSRGSAQALIGDQAYLFDCRIGLPIPGPNGQGVATLNQVLADPEILERMNLPGQSIYGTSRSSLLASPSRIGVLIDSSQGLLFPV